MTTITPCPGCGHPARANDCDHCEYFNLTSGRSHYCGDNACFCRVLRWTIRPEVLRVFAERFAADGGGTYQERATARLVTTGWLTDRVNPGDSGA